MTRRARAIARPASTARRWLTAFALLAFVLQSLAVQTHVHPGALPATTITAVHGSAPAPLKAQDPVDQCRLCHELLQAGAFVAPAPGVFAAGQLVSLAFFALLPAPPLAPAQAFDWQGRAPPRAA